MSSQIHWHEGLFLQPHHLQRLQKSLYGEIGAQRQLTWSYPYGIVEARLATDDLENSRIRFDRLRVIMPGGVEVDFPHNAELPALDIKKAFASSGGGFTIYLGVPLWFDRRPNAVEFGREADSRAKLLYRVTEAECADENTGENAKPLLFRRINARLLLENEDHSDLDVIPLLRIVPSVGESSALPRQDPDFIGPCLFIHGSTILREIVHDLASQVAASRQELVIQLTRAGFSLENLRGLQFEQLMRLRTLNRFAGTLPSLAEAPAVHPFTMYLELRELLGELTALHPDRDLFDVPAYNHDNPCLAFNELSFRIRSLLRGAVAATFLRVPFVKQDGVFTATFEDKHFTSPNDYFIAVETKEDPRALAELVENADEFKLMPRSMALRAIRGVLLKEERFVPLELPAKSGLHYFRALRSESVRSWEQIRTEKAAVIRWPEEASSDFELSMYMTLPGTPETPA